MIEQLVEFRTRLQRSGGGVGEDPVAAGRSECVVLESGVLVAGGDPGVAEVMSHTQKTYQNPCGDQ